MTTACIIPLPEKYRKIPKKYRPQAPPIFQGCGDGGISESDRDLARELYQILDDESKDWYRRPGWLEAPMGTRPSARRRR